MTLIGNIKSPYIKGIFLPAQNCMRKALFTFDICLQFLKTYSINHAENMWITLTI